MFLLRHGQIHTTARGIMVMGQHAELRCGTANNPFAGHLTLTLTGAPLDDLPAHQKALKRGIMLMNQAKLNLHAHTDGLAQRTRINENAFARSFELPFDRPCGHRTWCFNTPVSDVYIRANHVR